MQLLHTVLATDPQDVVSGDVGVMSLHTSHEHQNEFVQHSHTGVLNRSKVAMRHTVRVQLLHADGNDHAYVSIGHEELVPELLSPIRVPDDPRSTC